DPRHRIGERARGDVGHAPGRERHHHRDGVRGIVGLRGGGEGPGCGEKRRGERGESRTHCHFPFVAKRSSGQPSPCGPVNDCPSWVRIRTIYGDALFALGFRMTRTVPPPVTFTMGSAPGGKPQAYGGSPGSLIAIFTTEAMRPFGLQSRFFTEQQRLFPGWIVADSARSARSLSGCGSCSIATGRSVWLWMQ